MSNHILIVDDNRDILDVLRDALEGEGFKITALDYTEDIVKTVEQHQPDLVMLDFLLFGINGGELCHQIKHTPHTAHLPVILLSAYPRVLESLGNYGSDAFIQKPFDLNTLLNKVHYLIEHNAAFDEAC